MQIKSIVAMSDMYGELPTKFSVCELFCMCGDIFSQKVERNLEVFGKWFCENFFPWVKNLPCDFVIMIPENHCFYLESEFQKYGRIIIPDNLQYKCVPRG